MTITAEDVSEAMATAGMIPDTDEACRHVADFLNARLASRATARTDDVERTFRAGYVKGANDQRHCDRLGKDFVSATDAAWDQYRAALGDPK